MSVFKTFKFYAKTIDGKIQRSPKVFNIECECVTPIGRQVIRDYNGNECIEAVSVFLVYSRGQLLGSTDFKSLDEFLTYRNAGCRNVCTLPYLTINNCIAQINGCNVQLYTCGEFEATIFNCNLTMYGCNVVL